MFFPFSNTYNQGICHPGHRAEIHATRSSRTLELIIKYVGIKLGFAWMPGLTRHDTSFGPVFNNYALFHNILLSGTKLKEL
jgi:hypothetical protein